MYRVFNTLTFLPSHFCTSQFSAWKNEKIWPVMLTVKKNGKLSPSLFSHYIFIAHMDWPAGFNGQGLIRNVCSGRNTAAIAMVSDFLFNIIFKS